MDPHPWLSVVTVVKDDVPGLRRTAESLQTQDLTGIQWIVVDSSTDATGHRSLVEHATPASVYAWIPPSGVYGAMNHSLDIASGRHVWFVNAGDAVAPGPTTRIIRSALDSDPLWIIGQVAFVGTDGSRTVPPPFDYSRERESMFARGRFAPHQGTIVRSEWLRTSGGFDLSYTVAADYEASLRLSMSGEPVVIDAVIADFYVGGLSATRWRTAVAEFHRARTAVLQPTGAVAVRELAWTGASFARELVGAALRRTRRVA